MPSASNRTTLRIVPPISRGFEDRGGFHRAFVVAGTFPLQILLRVDPHLHAELTDQMAALVDAYARRDRGRLEIVDGARIA